MNRGGNGVPHKPDVLWEQAVPTPTQTVSLIFESGIGTMNAPIAPLHGATHHPYRAGYERQEYWYGHDSSFSDGGTIARTRFGTPKKPNSDAAVCNYFFDSNFVSWHVNA
jgi:hypothetical protein